MKKDVNQKSGSKQYYLDIDGQRIPVTESIYRAYRRPEWAEHKRRERSRKCHVEGGSRCTKSCDSCPYYMDGRNGGTLSLDALYEKGFDVPVEDDWAEALAYSVLLEHLNLELKQLAPTERLILRLFSHGKSERQISDELKAKSQKNPDIQPLSQKSVNLYKNRLFAALKEKLKDFYY